MARVPDEGRPDSEDDEGGPVKSFLEHLEDLRWLLLKVIVTLGLAMLICLLGANHVVGILKRPLEHAGVPTLGHNHTVLAIKKYILRQFPSFSSSNQPPSAEQTIVALIGTNKLGTYRLTPEQRKAFNLSPDPYIAIQLEPTLVNSNWTLGFKVDTNADAETLAKQLNISLNTMSPASGFFVAVQVALYGGIAISSPLLFYFICQFIFPALKWKERRYIYRGLFFFVPLFLLGSSFCYFILLPMALAASQGYSEWMGLAANIWQAEEYFSFSTKFVLGMGLGFQLPVVILILVKIGILNYEMLRKGRKYMILVNLILGALLTTPEVITQVLMAVPLQFLYEISVWIAWYWDRQDKKRAALNDQD